VLPHVDDLPAEAGRGDGLKGDVFTRDFNRALRVAEALDTGMVGLNQGVPSNAAAPFGGIEQSGAAARAAPRGSTSTCR
jgi:succinate-semialdehyde dehydrogenase/glutarate-semialdehyde dehydrogenase